MQHLQGYQAGRWQSQALNLVYQPSETDRHGEDLRKNKSLGKYLKFLRISSLQVRGPVFIQSQGLINYSRPVTFIFKMVSLSLVSDSFDKIPVRIQ